MDYVV